MKGVFKEYKAERGKDKKDRGPAEIEMERGKWTLKAPRPYGRTKKKRRKRQNGKEKSPFDLKGGKEIRNGQKPHRRKKIATEKQKTGAEWDIVEKAKTAAWGGNGTLWGLQGRVRKKNKEGGWRGTRRIVWGGRQE